MEWKYSSTGIRSLRIGVDSLSCAKDALAAMKPETRAALANPTSEKWHDGGVVIDAAEAVFKFAGDAGVEAMNYAAVKQSLGPLMAPFLMVTLALFGSTPDSLFKRLNESLRTVMKGVQTQWVAGTAKGGRLIITHPEEVREMSWPCWKGAMRFTFDMCRVTGQITERRDQSTPRTLVFDCSWE